MSYSSTSFSNDSLESGENKKRYHSSSNRDKCTTCVCCSWFWSLCCLGVFLITMIVFFVLGGRLFRIKYHSIDVNLTEVPCEYVNSEVIRDESSYNFIGSMKVNGIVHSFCLKRKTRNGLNYRIYGLMNTVNGTGCEYYNDEHLMSTLCDRFSSFQYKHFERLKPNCKITNDLTSYSYENKKHKFESNMEITLYSALIGFILLFCFIFLAITIAFICFCLGCPGCR